MISRQEAARLLDVSEQTVSNWVEKGIIKGHLIDKHLMIDRETIEQYFDDIKELSHLGKKIEEEKKHLQKEDDKLRSEMHDLLEARELMETAPHGVYRWIVQYATMSANGLFTDQQRTIYHRMLEWGHAEDIAKDLGLSRSRVVDTFFKCLRKISKVMALKETQDKWDKLEEENRRLNALTAALRQQLNECKAQMGSKHNTSPLPDDEHMMVLLNKPFDDMKLTVRAANVLRGFDCKTIGDVASLKKETLMNARFCGLKTIEIIEKELATRGLALGSDLQLLLNK